jgi:hypothetical protein
MGSEATPPSSARRTPLVAVALAVAAIGAVSLIAARQRSRREREQDLVIVEGIRKVCKLSTLEVALADYSKRTVPKTLDLPFTHEPEAYLFYSGVVSAGFDLCDQPTRLEVDHEARVVRVALPPARVLSLDVKRFETINERSGFLNAIAPEDRNGWFQDARKSLEDAALAQGLLPRAEAHARELLGDFVARWGYRLELGVGATEVAPTR